MYLQLSLHWSTSMVSITRTLTISKCLDVQCFTGTKKTYHTHWNNTVGVTKVNSSYCHHQSCIFSFFAFCYLYVTCLFTWKTSNKKYDWAPAKYFYLNILHHNRTQMQLQQLFHNVLQKYYQLPIWGNLDMSDHLHQKGYCQLIETLKLICMHKMNSIPNLFWNYLWRKLVTQ